MAKRSKSQESAAAMYLEMIAAGAYYWLRAEGQDENMVSALNRMKYRQMVERFDALNIPNPRRKRCTLTLRESGLHTNSTLRPRRHK